MTAEEFKDLAIGLFENDSEGPEKFNPIIDAAKELAGQGIKINNVDPNLLIYTLILLRKNHDQVELRINKRRDKIIKTVGFDIKEARIKITKQVEQIFRENHRQKQTFDKMVQSLLRQEKSKHRVNLGVKTTVAYYIWLHDKTAGSFQSGYHEDVIYVLMSFCDNIKNVYNFYINGMFDQYLL